MYVCFPLLFQHFQWVLKQHKKQETPKSPYRLLNPFVMLIFCLPSSQKWKSWLGENKHKKLFLFEAIYRILAVTLAYILCFQHGSIRVLISFATRPVLVSCLSTPHLISETSCAVPVWGILRHLLLLLFRLVQLWMCWMTWETLHSIVQLSQDVR